MNLNDLLVAGIDLGGGGAAAGAGRGMEIDRVDHAAVGGILEMHVDRVADANAQERPGHLAVEGPVAEGGPFGEAAFELDR